MSTKSLEPRQERSRESLRRLRRATAEVLGQHGLDGTTIPRIAAHAGLTPGAIYRRFRDKDALIEAVILGLLERQDERIEQAFAVSRAGDIPLAAFAEQLIGTLVLSYRANGSCGAISSRESAWLTSTDSTRSTRAGDPAGGSIPNLDAASQSRRDRWIPSPVAGRPLARTLSFLAIAPMARRPAPSYADAIGFPEAPNIRHAHLTSLLPCA
jgi:AcrR family transcriptional regulator